MVRLEYLEFEDIKNIIEWNRDKSSDFLLQWAGPKYQYPLTEEQIGKRLIDEANKENSDTYIYKVVSNETNKMIGTIELSKIDRTNGTAKICRFLIGEEDQRGKGIGKAALNKVLEIGFEVLKLNSISLGVFDFNESAIRCYEMIGFRKEKLIKNARKAGDDYWNLYEMVITKEE